MANAEALVGVAVLVHVVGLGHVAGYAVIPGFYIALGPPVGDRASRVKTVALTALLVACMTAVGAELSRSTPAVVVGLVVLAFVLGLLPRAGPSAAAMQLPLLTAFAYSAAFPLAVASVGARVGAVLVALPIYVLGAAVLFQTDARRPLVLGAAAGLGGASPLGATKTPASAGLERRRHQDARRCHPPRPLVSHRADQR